MEYLVDLKRIREALPSSANVKLCKKESTCYIECFVNPSLNDNDFEMCKEWQREILGDLILEQYTLETGRLWYVYLKREVIEFVNITDEDINSFTNMNLVKDGKVA